MNFEQFLATYSGSIMTVGGSIVVAAISAYAIVRARRVAPGREPTPVADIWAENRSARDEADQARADAIFLERKAANMGIAFLALWAWSKRLVNEWGSPQIPQMRREDEARIQRVVQDLEDLDTPPNGTPLTGHA